jgi:hypothetical protein
VVVTMAGSRPVIADPVVKLWGGGQLDVSGDGPAAYALSGHASHLGKYSAVGEVLFGRVDGDGVVTGQGPVAIRSANGDMLTGIAVWTVHPGGSGVIRFSWRDEVTFSDGSRVATSGRFAASRPAGGSNKFRSEPDSSPGIIAILIGP